MFAVISHKGNQYKVEKDKEYKIALMETGDEKEITFAEVLLIGDEKETKIGTPTVSGAKVIAEIVGEARGKKVTGIKFKPKKKYQRNLGSKPTYTVVRISSIES